MTRVVALPGLLVRWVLQFWTEPVRPESLALFRILLGTCLLLNLWITIIPFSQILFGNDGLCAVEALDPYLKRQSMICLLRGPQGIPLQQYLPVPKAWLESWENWGSTPNAVNLVLILFSLSSFCLTIGLWTRTATILAWLLDLTIFQRLIWVMNGGDEVARMALFYLMFSRCGAVWSVDAWRRSAKNECNPVLVPAWPIRLMQIQFCMIYFFSALAKLAYKFLTPEWYQNDWVNGEAVYWLYNDLEIVRWPYHWLPVPLWLCRLQTWAVIVFELFFSLFVLYPRTRPWTLGFGVLMHLAIWLHTEIAFFSPFMICWYLLFIPGNQWRGWFARVEMGASTGVDYQKSDLPLQNQIGTIRNDAQDVLAD